MRPNALRHPCHLAWHMSHVGMRNGFLDGEESEKITRSTRFREVFSDENEKITVSTKFLESAESERITKSTRFVEQGDKTMRPTASRSGESAMSKSSTDPSVQRRKINVRQSLKELNIHLVGGIHWKPRMYFLKIVSAQYFFRGKLLSVSCPTSYFMLLLPSPKLPTIFQKPSSA